LPDHTIIFDNHSTILGPGEYIIGIRPRTALRPGPASQNYEGARAGIALKPASYGAFIGYEAEFSAVADTVPVDVRVFFGHQPGKPAVAMQVFTLKGKLPHLSEQIRRSWSNVKYLQ